jgi:hypothetical protein
MVQIHTRIKEHTRGLLVIPPLSAPFFLGGQGGKEMKYRKKPVVIDAVQWTGQNHREMYDFLERKPDSYIEAFGKNFYINHDKVKGGLIIKTLEGEHLASIGDYIIRGVNGEFYPCKPDIFEKTYERVDETK